MGEERGCKEFRKHVVVVPQGLRGRRRAAPLAGPGRLAGRARRAARRAGPGRAVPGRRARHARAAARARPRRGSCCPRAGSTTPTAPGAHVQRGRRRDHRRLTAARDPGRVTGNTPGSAGPGFGRPFDVCALLVTSCAGPPPALVGRPLSATAKDQRCGHHRHKRDTNARRTPQGQPSWPARSPSSRPPPPSTVGRRCRQPSPRRRPRRRRSRRRRADARDATAAPTVSRSSSAPRPAASVARRVPIRRADASRPRRAAAQGRPRAPTRSSWTTAALNLWTSPGEDAEQLGAARGRQARSWSPVATTCGRAEVVVDGEARWVTAGYLSDEKPSRSAGRRRLVGRRARDRRLPRRASETAAAQRRTSSTVYRAVCAAFPEITSYGSWRAHGEHAQGRAIDIMVSERRWASRSRSSSGPTPPSSASTTSSSRQQIWTPERASEGWRYVADRGSATANHYDHVHVYDVLTVTGARPSAAAVGSPRWTSLDLYDDARARAARRRAAQAGGRARAHAVRARPGPRRARGRVAAAGRQDPGGRAAERRLRPQPADPQPRGRPGRPRPGPGARLPPRHRRDRGAGPRPRPPAVRAQRRAGAGRAERGRAAASRATPRRCGC